MRLTQRLGFTYASDTRGVCPFIPVWNAEPFPVPQLPTTLPTLDELIGLDGITQDNVAKRIFELSESPAPNGHVFTLHAELEGGKFLPVFESIIDMWTASGIELTSLKSIADELAVKLLPRHEIRMGTIAGRSGTLALQGDEFPGCD
jgi:hypothetical protein